MGALQHFPIATLPGSAPETPVRIAMGETIFGSPGAACQGVGVCRVVSQSEQLACRCASAPVRLEHLETSSQIRLLFPKESIPEPVLQVYFNQPLLAVNEPFALSSLLAVLLGLPSRIVKPGAYPITETAEHFELQVELAL